MTTKLDKALRRELAIAWADLVSGEAALATALNASIAGLGSAARGKQR